MKNIWVMILFMLAALAWAAAQEPGSAPEPSSGQATSPSSQAPGAGQSQPSTPGSGDQAGPQDQASNATVTEGCLGGSDPNYTITDKTGTAYKLNLPANANTSSLAPHVGESVRVKGDVKDSGTVGNASIKPSVEERVPAQPADPRTHSHRRSSRSKK
jgi:hypothetical protein